MRGDAVVTGTATQKSRAARHQLMRNVRVCEKGWQPHQTLQLTRELQATCLIFPLLSVAPHPL